MPRSVLVPALLIVLVLSACSSSGASPASSDPQGESSAPSIAPSEPTDETPVAGTELNACEIVTAADIEATLDLEPGDVSDGALSSTPTVLSPGHTDCDYSGEWGGLSVSLTPEDGANLFDAARGSYDDASDRAVTGADGAFWSAGTNRAFLWKGAVTVLLQFTHLTVEADWDTATTAIGQAAIDRVD